MIVLIISEEYDRICSEDVYFIGNEGGKMRKTIIALLTAVILSSFMLSSCGKTNETHDFSIPEYTADEIVIPDEKVYDDRTTELVRKKYAGYDYDGGDISIICPSQGSLYYGYISDEANEIWYEEDSAEVQQHSVFTRNVLTEDFLNVKIKPTWGGDVYDLYDRAKIIAMSGLDDFDLMLTQYFRGLLSGTMGYFRNIYDIALLDLDAYWWDQGFIDNYTFEHNKLFGVTGDAVILDDLAFKVMFYNSAMIENYGLDDPTVLVENGTWTLDAMVDMAAAVTSDTDGNSIMDSNDTWGILDNDGVLIINLFDGCGVHIADKDENDVPYLATENEVFVNTVQYIFEHVQRSGYVCTGKEGDNVDILKDDRGLFMEGSLCMLFDLRDMESDFGLLPLPKLNLEQKNYSSVIGPGILTAFSVPVTVVDTEKVGVFLNVYGGFSTDTVDRTLNEVILGAKLIRNKRTVDMLNYALDSKFYDWAKDVKWAYPVYQAMTDQGRAETFFFVSRIKSEARMMKSMLKMLLKGYSFYQEGYRVDN